MNRPRLNRRALALATVVVLGAACDPAVTDPDRQRPPPPVALVAPPAGFQETPFVALGFDPTAMEFAPDGRLFVAEQQGRLHVVKNGSLLPPPFLTVAVEPTAERGLLGVAFDPAFATNRFVYVYYTSSATLKNRVSRFTASATNPDVAVAGSEVVILDGLAGAAGYHNGGAIHFGTDGKLYVGVGDSHSSSNAQDLGVREGKLLRINPDGSVPSDNPFVGNPSARGEIWSLGLRNPFTFAVQPGTGRIHINDVGEATWEEINLGQAGANYGWPTCEGACANPAFLNPIYAYSHANGECAITGGTFYQGTQFPTEYVGSYFFADFCGDWIRRRRPDGSVADFASVASGFVVDLKVGPDGSLYYLSRAAQAVNRFTFGSGNRAPVAALTAAPTSGVAPLAVAFDASTSSDPDGDALAFSWDFGDGTTAAGVTADHTYASDGPYLVTLTADDQRGGVDTDTITIRVGNPPSATITLPADGATYVAGDTVAFAGEGADAEDGALGASAFSWTVLFHHENHTHPHVGPLTGARSGTFGIPTIGETSPDVWYRIYLTVTDASGLKTVVTRDVLAVKSTFTLDASPTGLTLTLDGQPVATPHTVTGVVGIQRTLGAPAQQALGPASYDFVSWSDGGAATHVISTPAAPTTYVATYAAGTAGLVASWDMNAASVTGSTLRDGSGSGNHGTIVGAVLAPGHSGDALAFDGNDYVSVADAASLRPQQLTLVAWINPSGTSWRAIFNKRRSGFLDSYTLRLDGTVPMFCLEPAAAETCLVGSGSSFANGEWSHIAATWDGTTMRIYKNGVADPSTATHTAASEYTAFPVLLGAEDQSGDLLFFLEGRLDDARMYSRALSASEIVALYQGGPPDTEPPSVPQNLAAPAVGASEVQLSWSASSDNVGVVSYNVYRDGSFRANTSQLTYTDQGLSASTAYTYEVSALDGAGLESGHSAPLTVTTATPPPTTTILAASFDAGPNGFSYLDDPFRATAAAAYASGAHMVTGGFSGGGLRVLLGGLDEAQVLGMSGGWRAGFTLGAPGDVTLTLRYRLTQSSEYESDEYAEALVSVDGVLRGLGGTDRLARLTGNGNGGTAQTTGWQLVELVIPGLAAGAHVVTIGAYNNKKTFPDETTEILIDDVVITGASGTADTEPPTTPMGLTASDVQADRLTLSWSASSDNVGVVSYNVYRDGSFRASTSQLSYTDQGLTASTTYTYEVTALDGAGLESGGGGPLTVTTADAPPPPPPPPEPTTLLAASFDTGPDGFTYLDDAFRATAAPAYASGTYLATGGFSGGGLRVLLGGIDDSQVLGMSGGWGAGFTLGAPGDVTIVLRYRLIQSANYESDEYSDALVAVDGVLRGVGGTDRLARLTGDGNGGVAQNTGWQLVELVAPGLAAGAHTVTIGGYNNKKTFSDETTRVLIDDVSIIVR